MEERRGATMRKERKLEVPETPGDVSLVNRFTLLEAVRPEDTASLRDGHVCNSKIGAEAELKSQTSERAVVVGDSIVRVKKRGFCGKRRDLRMVCCLPGARIQDITDRLQGIFKGEGEEPEVVVHVGINYIGKKRKVILQWDIRELGRRLKSKTSRVVIFGLLPVPRAGEDRNREIVDLNLWQRN